MADESRVAGPDFVDRIWRQARFIAWAALGANLLATFVTVTVGSTWWFLPVNLFGVGLCVVTLRRAHLLRRERSGVTRNDGQGGGMTDAAGAEPVEDITTQPEVP